MLYLTVEKLDAFKFDGVAESDNTRFHEYRTCITRVFHVYFTCIPTRSTSATWIQGGFHAGGGIMCVFTWLSAPPSASSSRSEMDMTWTARSAFSRSIWNKEENDIKYETEDY